MQRVWNVRDGLHVYPRRRARLLRVGHRRLNSFREITRLLGRDRLYQSFRRGGATCRHAARARRVGGKRVYSFTKGLLKFRQACVLPGILRAPFRQSLVRVPAVPAVLASLVLP